jgi:hypothetical protein
MANCNNVPRRKDADRRPARCGRAITAEQITVKGANGTLARPLSALVTVKKDGQR